MWEMETALTRDFCCRKHYLWLEYLPSDAVITVPEPPIFQTSSLCPHKN